jgi:transposase-like protein
VAEAELGRRSKERLGFDGDWRGAERLSGDLGSERRGQAGQGQLDELPARVEAARLAGSAVICVDKCLGLVENLAEFLPEAKRQRCVVHFYRNVCTAVPRGKIKEVAAVLKAIHGQEGAKAGKEKPAN